MGALAGHIPPRLNFLIVQKYWAVGMTSSMPAQFLDISCSYACMYSYTILKLNEFIVCLLFVCAELIEELARATELKFGMRVEDVVARNKL